MRTDELQLLRSEDLLNLARNPSAGCRKDAIRLLVERGSHYAIHPEIHAEASALIHSDPLILKKSDPASEVSGRKLPGLLDVLAKDILDTRALEQKSSAIEQRVHQKTEELRGSLNEKENALKQRQEELREALGGQLSDLSQSLRKASLDLSASVQDSAAAQDKRRKDLRDEILIQMADLVKKYEAYGQRIEKSEERLFRVERSVWRKFVDWGRGR